jgi:hypothetical protein
MKRLILAAALSVLAAALAIAVVAVVVKPASPRPIDAERPLSSVSAPAGLTAGTTPTSTGEVYVASTTSGSNLLTKLSVEDGVVAKQMTLEGTGATTSIAESGDLVCVGLGGADHGGLLSCFSTATAKHVTSFVTPGAVLDANGRTRDVGFDLLVDEGGRKFAVTLRYVAKEETFAITHHVELPHASVSLVALANGTTYFALGNDGTITSVNAKTGAVNSRLHTSNRATRLAISNDETHLYVLINNGTHARVDVVATVSGKVTSSLRALPSTTWILPSIDNGRLVEFAGTEHVGRIAEYRLSA